MPYRLPACPADLAGIADLLSQLPVPDAAARAAATARQERLTKPLGSLGRLEQLAIWLAGWQADGPHVDTPAILIFAGNHGVAARGVSAFPPSVTAQMVTTFETGGAAINQLAAVAGATLSVIPIDLDRPTADMVTAPAMTEAEGMAAIAAGWQAVSDTDADVFVLGEMGIGNTTAAAAICHALYGGTAADWTGAGSGVVGDARAAKTEAVHDAVLRHRATDPQSPLAALFGLGGRELAAMAGACLAARFKRVPVVLDGYVVAAAVAPLVAVTPAILGHCTAGHRSQEPGHRAVLDRFGARPSLELDLRLGEGSGAALALPLLRAAAACHTGMATFDGAGVDEPV